MTREIVRTRYICRVHWQRWIKKNSITAETNLEAKALRSESPFLSPLQSCRYDHDLYIGLRELLFHWSIAGYNLHARDDLTCSGSARHCRWPTSKSWTLDSLYTLQFSLALEFGRPNTLDEMRRFNLRLWIWNPTENCPPPAYQITIRWCFDTRSSSLLLTTLIQAIAVAVKKVELFAIVRLMAALPIPSPDARTMNVATFTFAGPSEEFGWTCGNDPQLKHIKKLNVGAYSEVHQVCRLFYLHLPWLPTCYRLELPVVL